MPSIRIDQSDLKCKNGCDFYGNPQWQGYCSICYRQRQRKEKASSATLPKPEQKRSDRGLKVTSRSSFSKFEEKRLRQSETLKKANILKFNVFKKSITDDLDNMSERKPPEFKIPAMVDEGMKRDFRVKFPCLSPQIEKDSRAFVRAFIMDVITSANVVNVDELSEKVQRKYQRFMAHMDNSPHFSNVDADKKELLMDFVEKHSMSYLHELPSVVFSPGGTDDERADRAMSERIQQLSWVGEKHLECKLDRSNPTCRQLLYKAISELLGMDSAGAPGGKLGHVRRACRHVLALCVCDAAPASADDLLPALIFTVLKANPPRLVSNINFVTRFCNAQRLMTGEGGYYFTNLCCAVSFIENLTAESLNMEKKEFDCYMAMPASIGGSSWAAALSLCAELREAEDQKTTMQQLLAHTQDVQKRAQELAKNALNFEEEITKKVQDILTKTPLEIKPRRELPRFGKFKNIKTGPLVDLDTDLTQTAICVEDTALSTDVSTKNIMRVEQNTRILFHIEENNEKNNILGLEEIYDSSQNDTNDWNIKQTGSVELLTPSPLGFPPFDSHSLDGLITPDDYSMEQLAPGLSNIHYDIDLSDSGDNSMAEDIPKLELKDPLSPEKEEMFDPFPPQRDPFSPLLEQFDQFSLNNSKTNEPSTPFELVPRLNNSAVSSVGVANQIGSASNDPFSPIEMINQTIPFTIKSGESTSILDDSDSSTAASLLPSPLKPQCSK